jgi:hypothetical protein
MHKVFCVTSGPQQVDSALIAPAHSCENYIILKIIGSGVRHFEFSDRRMTFRKNESIQGKQL